MKCVGPFAVEACRLHNVTFAGQKRRAQAEAPVCSGSTAKHNANGVDIFQESDEFLNEAGMPVSSMAAASGWRVWFHDDQ
jgi:hypothetical protein